MKIKLLDLINAQLALSHLFSGPYKKGYPQARLAYKFGLIQRTLIPFLAEFDRNQAALTEKYNAAQTLSNNQLQISFLDKDGKPDEKRARKFKEEWDELVSVEIDIGDTAISINEIEKCKLEISLTPNEMAFLWWLIKAD